MKYRAYLGYEKEGITPSDPTSTTPLTAKPTPATGWASMKPSIDITRDYFGLMEQATIKFGLPPNNDVDIGRLESLKDLLTVITGKPKEGYQCNNPKGLTFYPERKYHQLHYHSIKSLMVTGYLTSIDRMRAKSLKYS